MPCGRGTPTCCGRSSTRRSRWSRPSTDRVRLGPCVTNPATRDMTVTASAMATLQEVSGGRMDIGMGRGDSARRVIGQKPVTVEQMEHACRFIKDLAEGREVDYEGTPLQLKWSEGHRLPIWVAAYGPKALRACGRVADGLIMQLADPFILEWSLGYVREGAEEAGRPFEDIQIQVAAPAYLSDDTGEGARSGSLVPRARVEPRRRSGQAVRGRGPSAGAHRLHRSPRPLRLRRARQDRRRARRRSSPTRSWTGSACSAPRTSASRSSASSRRSA